MKSQSLHGGTLVPSALAVPQSPLQHTALGFAIIVIGPFLAFLDIQIGSASIEEVMAVCPPAPTIESTHAA